MMTLIEFVMKTRDYQQLVIFFDLALKVLTDPLLFLDMVILLSKKTRSSQ